jgi:hypothetical protein
LQRQWLSQAHVWSGHIIEDLVVSLNIRDDSALLQVNIDMFGKSLSFMDGYLQHTIPVTGSLWPQDGYIAGFSSSDTRNKSNDSIPHFHHL